MTSFKKVYVDYVKVFIYVFFVHSGLFKWIPFPLDLTLITGSICTLILMMDLVSLREKNIFKDLRVIHISFFLFCFWYLSTAIYTTSLDFWTYKARAILLLLCTFYYPFISLRNISINIVFSIFMFFSVIVCGVLGYLYLNDLLFLIIAESDEFRAQYSIPDYLSISEFLSCTYFITFIYHNKVFYLYRLLILFLIVLLGARAPLIIILLLNLFILLIKYKSKFFNFKNIIVLVLAIFFLTQVYEKWDGAENLRYRFENLKKFSEDQSASERVFLINKSIELIKDNPVLGIGIGAAGYEINRIDENQYPHNHFIEAYLETGIIGFVLILIFWISVFLKFKFNYQNKISLILSVLILILFFNYMKSNSFIDARKMFIWVAIFLVFGLNTIPKKKN